MGTASERVVYGREILHHRAAAAVQRLKTYRRMLKSQSIFDGRRMNRRIVSEELAKFFGVLAHPLRIQIVEELNDRELTVNDLQSVLGVAHASVSQHLGILRNNRVVVERRQGRHVYYHLRQPKLAKLVSEALLFISPDAAESAKFLSAIESARTQWTTEPKPTKPRTKKN